MTEVSVVIAAKNESGRISGMLDALAGQTFRGAWEVVIADNGSTDDTAAVALASAGERLQLRVVDAKGPPSCDFARNVGGASCSSEKLIFVDADDLVNSTYVEALARALDDTPLVCARLGFSELNPSWLVEVWPNRWQQTEPIDDFRFLPSCGGGTIGIRRLLFAELAGFRPRLPPSQFEECDLCWRAQLAGYAGPAVVPEAVLEYRLPITLSAMYRRNRSYARGQRSLHETYGQHGLKPPRRTSLREVLGALRRLRSRRDAMRAAGAMGRFAGQRLGPSEPAHHDP